MLTAFVLVAVAIVGLTVFLGLRERAYPAAGSVRLGLSRKQAIARAGAVVRDLVGVDVSRWRVVTGLWAADELLDELNRRGELDGLRDELEDDGLLVSWRVRFVGPSGTVLVGLAPGGDVVLLEVDEHVNAEIEPAAGEPWPRRLAGSPSSVWARACPAGHGEFVEADGAREVTQWWDASSPPLGVRLGVRSRGGHMREVRLDARVAADGGRTLTPGQDALLDAGGTLLSALAVVAAVVVLVAGDLVVDWALAGVFCAAFAAALALVERPAFETGIVAVYERGMSWRQTRIVSLLASALSGGVLVAVVGLSALAGAALAREDGIALWTQPLTQVAWGLALAGIWAALRTLTQAEGRRRGWLRVAPELEDEALRAGGHGLRQVVSLTLQSAIAEETVYRMLAISLLSSLMGAPWLAVAVTAALWALVHGDSGVWPRWPRWIELGVAGLALGTVVLEVGFLAALVAHAAFNATLLSTPLLAGRGRRLGRALRGRSAPRPRPSA